MMDVKPLRAAIEKAPGDEMVVGKAELHALVNQVEHLQRMLTNIGSIARTA